MNILSDIGAEYSSNKVKTEDKPIHNWYRFVLSFPPHLVKYYFSEFGLGADDTVLDPFSGTGTTLVESKLGGINSVGIEANPIVRFATHTKLDWSINTDNLQDASLSIANRITKKFRKDGINDVDLYFPQNIDLLTLPEKEYKLLIKNSISEKPLHKSLILLDYINKEKDIRIKNFMLLAFLKSTVKDVSNLRFGPEIGIGKLKDDVSVLKPWIENVNIMKNDLQSLDSILEYPTTEIHLGDARICNQYLESQTINAVITSPPYPNEKDYSRTTRLENVLLGLVRDKLEMRAIKKTFVRSNTRSIYKEDQDHLFVENFQNIQHIASQIEKRRIELNKTSGFERMYHRVVLQYFGGMAKHLSNLRETLVPGARLAYVVGDQASFLRVMIRTGNLLAEIAESLGFEVENIELFRTRYATVTKEQLREEVLILKWNGNG